MLSNLGMWHVLVPLKRHFGPIETCGWYKEMERADFRACGIWPLNFEAMKAIMKPSKSFFFQLLNDCQDNVLI